MFQITIPAHDNRPEDEKLGAIKQNVNLLGDILTCRERREGRIKSSDRHAIKMLSDDSVKPILGRYRSRLSDITHKCREQDVRDLSIVMSRKALIEGPGHGDREYNFFITNRAQRKRQLSSSDHTIYSAHQLRQYYSPEVDNGTSFPAGRILKTPSKSGIDLNVKTPRLPNINIEYCKGVHTLSTRSQSNLFSTKKLNGSIQKDLYTQHRLDQLAPLLLPLVDPVVLESDTNVEFLTTQKMKLAEKRIIQEKDLWLIDFLSSIYYIVVLNHHVLRDQDHSAYHEKYFIFIFICISTLLTYLHTKNSNHQYLSRSI